ncbi:Hypothetical predicted protein [Xyrichtys novacula]|uniref:Uncharacterized protein n=1 Tax=Xyrichtys novacula TaxID=13765 RepID=A0AAV1H746_XYRNO|nr:Hypothetical predicted protein [Xyrichtys novacula]
MGESGEARAAAEHTAGSERILRPGEPRGAPGVHEPRAVSEQPRDGGCEAEHPAASSGSASYCLRIAPSSRMGGRGGGEKEGRGGGGESAEERSTSSEARKRRGGEKPSLSFLLWPIAAQLRREPPLLLSPYRL